LKIIFKRSENMTAQHTPGPWKVVTSWGDFMVEGPNGEEIIWQDGNYDTPTIKLEDARLMAAAPDLLEALKDALCALECCGKDFPATIKASAAIVKATTN
jgi:hypothetical protein